MIEPTGYTALDLIGFTDRGGYNPDAYYVKNDIVTVGNTKWRCLIDDTHNITPTEGANWTIYLESATSLAGMDDVTLTSPKNGDGLVHDGNDWKNIPITTKEQWQKNGAYNICPNNATSQVIQGVTYTVKSDGTISASNTASANSVLGVCEGIKFKAGTYKVVGTPTGGNYNTGYSIYVQRKSDYSTVATDASNSGGLTPIFVADGNTEYNVLIMVRSGATSPANDFKPMITTDLNATYDDYVPHAKTNRELTEDVTPQVNGVYTKIGKLVVFSVSSWNDSATAISNGIPIGYRPKNTTISVVEQRLTASTGTPEMKRITFNTNGTIALSDSNTVFIGTCSWVTA